MFFDLVRGIAQATKMVRTGKLSPVQGTCCRVCGRILYQHPGDQYDYYCLGGRVGFYSGDDRAYDALHELTDLEVDTPPD